MASLPTKDENICPTDENFPHTKTSIQGKILLNLKLHPWWHRKYVTPSLFNLFTRESTIW